MMIGRSGFYFVTARRGDESICQPSITADVEVIPFQQVNEAYERMLRSEVKYRFALDAKSLRG